MNKTLIAIFAFGALLAGCTSDDDTGADASAASGGAASGGAASGGAASGGSAAEPPPADLSPNCAVVYDWLCGPNARCSDANVDFTNQCNWARGNQCDFCAATLSSFAALQPTCNWMEPVPTAVPCQ